VSGKALKSPLFTTGKKRLKPATQVSPKLIALPMQMQVATGHHDMRKSINGLPLVVVETPELDPMGPHWFAFHL
jgi:hypothetical protein